MMHIEFVIFLIVFLDIDHYLLYRRYLIISDYKSSFIYSLVEQ